MNHRFELLITVVLFSTRYIFGLSSGSISRGRLIAPETTESQRQGVTKILDLVYGDENSNEWEARRSQARASGEEDQTLNVPQHELVYGELGLDALATILDAVGVEQGDRFMDIGSGDGMLVSAASMLYSDFLESSMGVEIVPDLYERSLKFQNRLENVLQQIDEDEENPSDGKVELCRSMSLDLGNVYEPNERTKHLFSKTTLGVCFATTWSRNEPGRKLPKLSSALGNSGSCELPAGSKLVIIDGVLDHENDGFDFVGQFNLFVPDTAPFSIARLYTKL